LEFNKNMDTGKLTAIQLGQIVRLMHTGMKTWLKVESNKNKEADSHTIRSDSEVKAH
jgi:hypothetical protein